MFALRQQQYADRLNRKVKLWTAIFVDNSDVGKFVLYFSFLDYTLFFVKRTSIGPISDQICEKILKAKFTNSDGDFRSLGNTVYRSFIPRFEPSKPSHEKVVSGANSFFLDSNTPNICNRSFRPH